MLVAICKGEIVLPGTVGECHCPWCARKVTSVICREGKSGKWDRRSHFKHSKDVVCEDSKRQFVTTGEAIAVVKEYVKRTGAIIMPELPRAPRCDVMVDGYEVRYIRTLEQLSYIQYDKMVLWIIDYEIIKGKFLSVLHKPGWKWPYHRIESSYSCINMRNVLVTYGMDMYYWVNKTHKSGYGNGRLFTKESIEAHLTHAHGGIFHSTTTN